MVSRRFALASGARQPGPAEGVSGARRGEEGYNLVMLVVAVTILNILVAIALPAWSYTIRRDREEETIFRGLQYAEGIRVFRQRFGRYPASLDELVKVEPRSMRQLWNEPLTEDGEFGLVVEAPLQLPNARPGGAPAPGQPGSTPGQPVPMPPGPGGGNVVGGIGVGGGSGRAVSLLKLPRATGDEKKTLTTTNAPLAIHGVYLDYKGESLRKFLDQDKYEQWVFTAELIPAPVSAPGRPLPRVRDDWIGKSFPDGLTPALGAAGAPPGGRPLAPGTGPGTKGKPQAGGVPPAGEKEPSIDESPSDDDDVAPDEFPEDFPPDLPDLPQDEVTPQDDASPPDEDFSGDDTGAGESDTGADESP
jgi:type II secretory pathway pseudopilin PulG